MRFGCIKFIDNGVLTYKHLATPYFEMRHSCCLAMIFVALANANVYTVT